LNSIRTWQWSKSLLWQRSRSRLEQATRKECLHVSPAIDDEIAQRALQQCYKMDERLRFVARLLEGEKSRS